MQVCSADLTVPVLHGAIIEGVATLICRLGSRLVALKEPQYDLDDIIHNDDGVGGGLSSRACLAVRFLRNEIEKRLRAV